MSDYAISWNFLGDGRILPTATDLFFHLPLPGTLTSAVVVHRRLDNLERERRKIKDVFGHFTNETKTNKKQRNGTDLGSNLFMPRQGFIQILSVSLALSLFKCFQLSTSCLWSYTSQTSYSTL